MLLDSRPFEQLTAADILALIPDVAENRRLDYKQAIPEDGEKSVRSFLNDVCALANSAGGYLIYGVGEERDENEEKTGVPSSVCGVAETNEDNAILDWQQRINQCIEPHIIGHRIGFVGGFDDGKKVMLVYVPKSLFAPHRVTYKGSRDFYIRHDRGNQLMGMSEIRHAFVEAKEVPQRIDEFRRLRVSQILAGETPIELLNGCAIFAAHVIPLSSFSDSAGVDVTAIYRRREMPTIGGVTDHSRLNADGYLFHYDTVNDSFRGYIQLFRTGVIELSETVANEPRPDDKDIMSLSSGWLEKGFIKFVAESLSLLEDLGVQPPVYVGLSLMRVKGASMYQTRSLFPRPTPLIDKDTLIIPTVTSETMTEDAGKLIRPALDGIWQASGTERSPNYNEKGEWELK